MGNGNTQTIEILPPRYAGTNKTYKLQVALDGKNFIEEPFVTLTVNNKDISGESEFTQCGPNDIKDVVVKYVEEGTGRELAARDVYKGYNISMIRGFDIQPKKIKGYEVVKSPQINLDSDYVDNGRVYEYVYRVIPQAENPFTDVKPDAFYYDSVLWAVKNEITAGTSETTFGPDNSCTRAQAVTFLWRAYGKPEPKQANNQFMDIKETDYYYEAVLWAVENGVTAGTSASTFTPNRTVTRAEFVSFLWRAEGKETADSQNPFVDVNDTAFYYDAVLWAVKNGVTAGTSASTFSPDKTCTRGEVVTFLYRKLAQ